MLRLRSCLLAGAQIPALLALFTFFLEATGHAQAPCSLPPVTLAIKGETIFSPDQERQLGEILAEQLRLGGLVYPATELTEPLNRIAASLLKYFPNTPHRFEFSLLESPVPNAFVLPGGKVYVSTRLVALAESEDELAGVIGHEMGHVLARQGSIDLTKAFKDTLGVSTVGDREDLLRKVHQLIDSRKPSSKGRREGDDQAEADKISVEAMSRAGYDPQALPRLFDRMTQNQGETGGFFSDLFGITSPESRRFREMSRSASAIPAVCKETRRSNDAEFKTWQNRVAALRFNDLISSATNRKPTRTLTPKLRPLVTNIRFSPNGNLLIVQEESAINIVRRDPFEQVFRIPALGARSVMFNKDSSKVSFTAAGRLETWNLSTRIRERVWQPSAKWPCGILIPSPDSRIVACIPGNSATEVLLIDSETNTEITRHKFNLAVSVLRGITSSGATVTNAAFSPDGSAFLAIAAMSTAPWAFDLNKRTSVNIGDPLKGSLSSSFAFVGSDRVVTTHVRDAQESGVFSWPDGKRLDKFYLPPRANLTAAANGADILIRPLREYAVGVLSLRDKEVFQVSASPALDRYGPIGASERASGEIALYALGQTQPVATLALTDSDLLLVRSAAHSPDLQWLAVSGRDRGFQWNLRSGESSPTVAFDAPYISPQNIWNASFERRETVNGNPNTKTNYRAMIDLERRQEISSTKVSEADQNRLRFWSGKYILEIRLAQTPTGKPVFQIEDRSEGRVLWSKEIEGRPTPYLANVLVLRYTPDDKGAERLLKQSPELKRALDAVRDRDDASLFEVLSLETGTTLGQILIEDGQAGILSAQVAGRSLLIEDDANRTLSYALDSGLRIGQQFGRVLAVDSSRARVAMSHKPGSITVFNESMRPLETFEFPRHIIYAGFDGNGKRLLVLSGAQEVFIEDIPD
jgi:WD40 repeat protein